MLDKRGLSGMTKICNMWFKQKINILSSKNFSRNRNHYLKNKQVTKEHIWYDLILVKKKRKKNQCQWIVKEERSTDW